MTRLPIIKFGWICIAFSIIGIVAWLNKFPEGMVFAAGDVVQYFNQDFVKRNFNHLWSNIVGEGGFSSSFLYYPFYAVLFKVSDIFSLNPSQQSFLYMAFFWGGAYVSCLFGLSLISCRKFSVWSFEASLFSLIYALNPYTFYAFFFIWGYTPFLYLYVAIPIFVIATIEFFNEDNWQRSKNLLVILFFTHLFSTIAYGNLAFFISANLVLLILIISNWVLISKLPPKKLFIKICLFFTVELVATGWAVLPQLPSLLFENSPIKNDDIFDLGKWVLWQRLSFWEIFSLNPLASIYGVNRPFAMTSGLIISGLAIWLGCKNRTKSFAHKQWLAALCTVLIIALIESKGKGFVPDTWTIWAFSNPILGALRSNGKAYIFLPFLVLLMLFLSTSSWRRHYRNCLMLLVLTISIFSTYPLFFGGLPAEYLGGSRGDKICRNSKSCYLVRIPSEYNEAAAVIKKDGLDGKILGLPYSVISSPGWSNYPEWKHVGVDPTTQLFSLPVVQMNMYHAFGRPYGLDWAENDMSQSEFFQMVSDLGVSYLMFHKGISKNFSIPAARHLREYEQMGLIHALYKSDTVSIYRVAEAYLRPAITAYSRVKFDESLMGIDVMKVNPTKYIVTLPVSQYETNLVLREAFSRQWRIHISPPKQGGLEKQLHGIPAWWRSFFSPLLSEGSHSLFHGYGNQWKFNTELICRDYGCAKDKSGAQTITLVIEYWPQRYLYLLQTFTSLVALCLIINILRVLMIKSSHKS